MAPPFKPPAPPPTKFGNAGAAQPKPTFPVRTGHPPPPTAFAHSHRTAQPHPAPSGQPHHAPPPTLYGGPANVQAKPAPAIARPVPPPTSFGPRAAIQRQAAPAGRFVPPQAGGAVVQRMEEEYSRPSSFYAPAEKKMTVEYNDQNNTSYKKVPFLKLDLARCHITPFDKIRDWLYGFEDDPSDNEEDFRNTVETFVAECTSSAEAKKVFAVLDDYIEYWKNGKTTKGHTAGGKLIKLLNSASLNLRAGNTYVNSYIGAFFDPYAVDNGSGKYSFTSATKAMMHFDGEEIGPLVRTPRNKSRIITSNGVFSPGDLTPRSSSMAFNHPYVTKTIGSDNVEEFVYGQNN